LTDYIYLKGKASWVQAHKVNEYGKWSMMLHPDTDSLNIIRDLQAEGVKNVIKKDDDGYFVRLARPHEIKVKGKIVGMVAPEIYDGNKPLKDENTGEIIGFYPFKEYVGNGSDVIAKCEVYQHGIPGSPGKKAKAIRWLSLRVDNLIPYTKKSFDDASNESVAGFADQPKQLF
jgi:hypothetical protein